MEANDPSDRGPEGSTGQDKAASVAAASATHRRCSSSRSGKVMLSCWIPEAQRLELDRLWASQGLRPHGRTQQGMETMIAAYLQSQRGQ
jgi:hypothetical protein